MTMAKIAALITSQDTANALRTACGGKHEIIHLTKASAHRLRQEAFDFILCDPNHCDTLFRILETIPSPQRVMMTLPDSDFETQAKSWEGRGVWKCVREQKDLGQWSAEIDS